MHMFTIYFHGRFHTPSSRESLGTIIKLRSKKRFYIVAMLILQKVRETNLYFWRSSTNIISWS